MLIGFAGLGYAAYRKSKGGLFDSGGGLLGNLAPGVVMSGRAPADQGLFFRVALVAGAVMSSAFLCGE
jgi:hypothetical protein